MHEHSRHRSPINFAVNLMAGLIAYCHQPKKPSLVAFSGEVYLKELPNEKFTEVSMNDGIKEKELPSKFDTEE